MVVGGLLGGWHALWILLILLGWAQALLDFVFWAHMIQSVYVVKPFDPRAAIALVLFSSVMGYAFGLCGAMLWNKLQTTQ